LLADRTGQALGSRELRLDSARCEALTETLALIVAVMLDPDPAPPPPELPAALPVVVAAPPPPPAPPPWRLGVGLGPVLATGVTPGPGFGVGVQAALGRAGRVAYGAALEGFLPAEQAIVGEAVGRFQAGLARLRACPRLAGGDRVRLEACLSVEAGLVRYAGRGFDVEGAGVRVHAGAALGPALELRLTDATFVRLAADAAVPFVRHRYVFTEADGRTRQRAFEAPVAGARAHVGVGWRF
jgi:hypothetical protein